MLDHFKYVLRIFVLGALILGWAGVPAMASPVQQDNLVPLVYGQTVDGTIDAAQPSVFYQFQAAVGDVITVTMIVTGGAIDPFLVLNNAEQIPLTTDDNSGGGVNARLTFVIPADGAYVIQATHAGGIPPEGGGTFSLNLTTAVGEGVPTSEPIPVETPAEPASDIPVIQGDSTRLVKLQTGTTVRDTLDRQVALRFYWFEAELGAQVAITPEQLADFQPLIVLYNAAFVEQQRAAPGAGIRTNLPEGGIYFVAVSLPDTGSAGGGYGFVFEQSANLATSENYIDIAYGESQSGNIDVNVPAVTYRFNGSAGDTVTITMSRAGGDLNSYLYLLDGQGQLLYEDNDSGGDNGDARISYVLPGDGIYLIVATRLGQAQGTTSGSYLLDLASDATPPAAPSVVEETEPVLPPDYQAFPTISYGQTVEGELSSAKFMDIYVFLGHQGDAITVDLVSLNPTEANGLDPLLVLLDDGRIPLAEHDDIVDGVDRNSHLEFTLSRTAYYAIVATRFDQDAGTTAGPYELTLSGPGDEETPTEPEEEPVITNEALINRLAPTPLAPDTASQATFDAGAALYTFAADSGTLIDLSATTDPGLDSILILTDENLNEIMSSGTGALTGITIPKTGEYLVILAPRFGPVSGVGGGYILALAKTDEQAVGPTGPQALAYGDTVNGVIDDEKISQTYTFVGSGGDEVRIKMEATPGSGLDCYLELQGPDGAVVDANDDIDPGVIRDSLISTELPADGTYTILASRYVGPDADPTMGMFQLSLSVVDENTPAAPTGGSTAQTITPLTYGQTEVDEIGDDQYLVFYVFEGTVGDMVTIEVNNLTGNLDSVLHLYRSEGDQWVEIANNDDSPTGGTYEALLQGVILPQTGKYLIAVNRYGLDRERTFGTFAITLTLESQ